MASDTQIWQHWLQWLPSAAPGDLPGPIFQQYRRQLVESGISETEADSHLAAILRLMGTRAQGWRPFFNKIYASPSPGFNTHPNALLASAVAGRVPGRALDVSTGQGRNAVFLATQGWKVTAIDVSDEGLAIAARNAEAAGVHLHTVLANHEDFDFGIAAWDLIVVTYAPVPLTSPNCVRKISDALRPGGAIVIESFASDATQDRRTPVDLDPADLRRAYEGFRALHFADTIAMSDWDKKEIRLARLVAEKKRDANGVE